MMDQRLYFPKSIVVLSLKINLSLQTMHTLLKCSVLWHFVRAFTVCKSTLLGVFSLQRVDITFLSVTTRQTTILPYKCISANMAGPALSSKSRFFYLLQEKNYSSN